MTNLNDITHLVIDMDGVLYRGNDPVRGLSEFIGFLRDRPIPFRMATNNSGLTPTQYAAKLAKLGVAVAPEEIITSGTATALIMAQQLPAQRVSTFSARTRCARRCWSRASCWPTRTWRR